MKLCYFGTYDRNYSRNQTLLAGLAAHGVAVLEVHTQYKQLKLDNAAHLGPLAVFHRVFRKLSFLPVVMKSLPRIKECDAILCAYPGHLEMPLAYLVAKLLGKPLLFDPLYSLTETFTDDFGILNTSSIFARLLYVYEKIIFNLPDILLADTEYRRQNYLKLFRVPAAKTALVPLGAADSLYRKATGRKRTPVCRIIYYGLYNPVHGVEVMVEAAYRLRKEPKLEFLFIGDGQTYPQAEAMIQKLGITSIRLLKLAEAQALPYLKTGDIFLGLFAKSKSVEASVPNKVLQGMALGIAVISEDGPAVRSAFDVTRELVVVHPADSTALAAAIRRLARNPARRRAVAEAGYTTFKQKYTAKAVAKQLIDIISVRYLAL